MSFTYDITSTIGKMRFLLGDTVAGTANFQDEELQFCLTMTSGQLSGPVPSFGASSLPENHVLFMACASAIDALASRVAGGKNGQSIQIGDFKLTGRDQVSALQAIAQRFREAIDNIPAYAIAEENSSGFNELVIIRNWVLRTEM